ncbi:MAG: hypothetical protein AAFV53_32870 [Myxococcota bacterium]
MTDIDRSNHTPIRGRFYQPIGVWRGLAVLRTERTDSMFNDAATLSEPVVLTTRETHAADTGEAVWPGPPGNLYLCVPHQLSRSDAIARAGASIDAFFAHHFPGVVLTLRWDGPYGAHRDRTDRFVSGITVKDDAIGIDVHLHGAYEPNSEHAALGASAPQALSVDEALWAMLAALEPLAQ